jgi:anti-anti-sigma regulatory factor
MSDPTEPAGTFVADVIQWHEQSTTFKIGAHDGIRLIRLSGDVCDEMPTLGPHLDPPKGDNKPRLVINIGEAVLTSQVIGALVASNNQHNAAGGKIVLCNVAEQSRTILSLCKLLPLFTILDDETAAVAKLRSL